MWLLFFILAVCAVLALLFFLTIELNELDKSITELTDELKDFYGNR